MGWHPNVCELEFDRATVNDRRRAPPTTLTTIDGRAISPLGATRLLDAETELLLRAMETVAAFSRLTEVAAGAQQKRITLVLSDLAKQREIVTAAHRVGKGAAALAAIIEIVKQAHMQAARYGVRLNAFFLHDSDEPACGVEYVLGLHRGMFVGDTNARISTSTQPKVKQRTCHTPSKGPSFPWFSPSRH